MSLSPKYAWKRMFEENYDAFDSRKNVDFFNKYLEYDEDTKTMDFHDAPALCAELLLKSMNVTKDSKILDVGAGTGHAGKAVRNQSFSGELHAIDGSFGMLEKAKSKNIYDKLECQFLDSDTEQINLPHNYYNGIIAIASFNVGLIHYEVIKKLIPLLLPQGILVLSVKHSAKFGFYKDKVEELFEHLEEKKSLKKLEVRFIKKYFCVNYEDANAKEEDKKKPTTATMYCYQKM